MTTIKLSAKIGEGYREFWNYSGRYLVVKGGRGSKKSTTAAMKIIYLLMKYPLSNALIIRQVMKDHRDSTWKQLKWAAHNLGVGHLWDFTLSPLQAKYKPTGQTIYFRGLDDPLSITSITVDKGFLNLVWFEEAYQIMNEDDFDKIDMSIRGELPDGYFKQIILTFNPWSDKIWIKKRFFDVPNNDNKLAMTTTYRCNEWLGDDDLRIFEEMKERQPSRYAIEGDGNWGVSEGLVFDNWRVESFNVDELDFPIYIGLDFGWSDPTAIAVMRIDDANKRLFLCSEFFRTHQTLESIAEYLKSNYRKQIIYCDSAEPRSIDSLVRLGVKAKAAKKGQGSIMEGIRKLQEYEIIIHPSCQNAVIEFSNYAFDKDKVTGEWTDKPIDAFCHIIDAMRYGIQGISNKKQMKTMNKSSLF